ncbi:2-octaprenyl-6-methoxyphenyl hydroxylase [Phytohalomonas tamaricis]|uniref:2-octaprenyl-6-methoxyphenyl hydroxylase n=1 Tax=Phytohalomonas tamaricis TaxID=2081032 RepID=UPI000D0B3D29|nr:2-octaprenyl-6-methoxyphenyl hydroxylase [Phytohalomonas tamaricis]
MANQRVDVAIIGGGLVGASLACALAPLIEHHNLSVAVIEAAPLPDNSEGYQPSFDERASAIAYGSRLHFEQLQVWTALRERASPIRHIHISERGRFGATRLNANDVRLDALGYVLPNAWIGRVLLDRLAQLSLDWRCPARVTEISPKPSGHRLVLDNGDVLDAGLTVLADGGRSGLKEQLGIESVVEDYAQYALITNVEMGREHGGQAFERFTPQGALALLPLAGQRMELIWTHRHDSLERTLALDDRDFLRAIQHHFGDRVGRFRRVGKRFSYPLSLIQAREQTRPHLAVLGNAAHALHPVAGQGFNLALRGVMDLCASLKTAIDEGHELGGARAMADFESRRARDRDQVIRFSDGLIRLFGIDNPLFSHARAAGLIGLNLAPPLKRTLMRYAMGLER